MLWRGLGELPVTPLSIGTWLTTTTAHPSPVNTPIAVIPRAILLNVSSSLPVTPVQRHALAARLRVQRTSAWSVANAFSSDPTPSSTIGYQGGTELVASSCAVSDSPIDESPHPRPPSSPPFPQQTAQHTLAPSHPHHICHHHLADLQIRNLRHGRLKPRLLCDPQRSEP